MSKPRKRHVQAALRHCCQIEGLERRLLLSSALVRFAAEQTFGVGLSPNSVVAADVNGDGHADLVVANYYSNSVGILLGNGNGTFKPEQELPVGREPFDAIFADVNGDGTPDLVVTNYLDHTVSVLLGNGGSAKGTFQSQRTFSVGLSPANVVAANLNGKIDLIVTNDSTVGTVSILLGNGDGTFQAQSTLAVGSHPNNLVVADLNGDGKPDLVVANFGATTVSVMLGNGNGTFHAQQTVNVGTDAFGITLADLNGDGKLDLIAGSNLSTANAVSVLLGNGDGTFQAIQTVATGRSPSSIVVADLNGDGIPDLAVTNYIDRTIGVLLGNGNGTFLHQRTLAFACSPGHITAADLDGDGIPDLIAVQENFSSLGVVLNRSVPPQVLSIIRTSPAGATVSAASATFTVTFNKTVTGVVGGDFPVVTTGGVTFTGTSLTPVSGTVYTFEVSGISGAGTLGLNLVDNGTIHDLAGQPLAGGSPSFVQQQNNIGQYATDVVTGDVNGDGNIDVAVAHNALSGFVDVLLGNGNGTLQPARTFAVGKQPDGVAIADFNGDGKRDLVVANYGEYNPGIVNGGTTGNISILLGNGNGTFQAQKTFFSAGVYPSSVQVTDVNGDGRPDLIVGSNYQTSYYNPTTMVTYTNEHGAVSVLLGNGDGTFKGAPTIVGLSVGALPVIADFNGDGKPDLAVFSGKGKLEVLLGNGDGTFQAPRTFNVGTGSLVAGDVNGDGVADLVVNKGVTTVLLGLGNGSFQAPLTSSTPGFYASTIADLNGDGVPDLVGSAGGNVGVLLGNGDGTFAPTPSPAVATSTNVATADLNHDGRPDVISADYISGSSSTVNVLLDIGGGNFDGQVYTVISPPTVSSINRLVPSTPITSASSLSFALTFTSNVTNVLPSDFRILTTGDVAATTPVVVSGSGSSYTVTVNGVHGSGTLDVELVDNDTITDTLGTPLAGVGLFNGTFTGQAYTIDQTFPTVLSINRATPPGPTTVDSSVSFTVTFSESVTGVAPSDFSLALAGVGTTPPLVVTGSGALYTVTVNGLSNSGTLGLNLLDNGAIRDVAGNPLQGGPASFALQNQQTFTTGSASAFVATSDVNGDGKPDLIIANNLAGVAGAVSVLLNNGNGTFTARQTFAAGPNPYFVVVSDVNGDGIPDLIVANQTASGTVSVLLGNGNGSFGAPQSFAIGVNPRSIALADVNADGRPDLVVGSGGFVSVLLGNGNGTFQAQTTLAAGTHPYSVAVADVNGDAKADLLVANLGGNTASVFLGNGNGTFSAQQTFAVGASPRGIAAADVNGDGLLDLIVPSGSGSAVSILLGNGNGAFQSQQTFATTGAAYGLAVADVNGDGKLDLLLGANSGSAISLLLGNGNGTFLPSQTFATGASPASVAFADFNGDGRPDLASANNVSGTSSLLLNSSNGSFTGQTYIIVPPADTINGTTGPDTVTLTRDTDGTDIDWALFSSTGSSSGMLPINDPHGLTINGNGGNDSIVLSSGNPLPDILHLNGTFTISGLSGSNPLAGTTLEIGRSTVFVNYGSPANEAGMVALIRQYLAAGYNGGAWNGVAASGVITSTPAQTNPNHNTAIGWADSGDGSGVNTMPNTIEMKYTLNGDANLNGATDIFDLNALLPHFNGAGDWTSGDFTYNGKVDIFDLNALLPNFNTSLPAAAPAVAPAAESNSAILAAQAPSGGGSANRPVAAPMTSTLGTGSVVGSTAEAIDAAAGRVGAAVENDGVESLRKKRRGNGDLRFRVT